MEDQEQILQRALNTWNGVPCAAVALTYGGRVSVEGSLADGERVDIGFVRPPERWPFGGSTGFTSVRGFDPSDPTPRGHRVDISLNGVDYFWDDGVNDPTLTVLDMESVVIHELGHVLGLPHAGCPDGFCSAGESNSSTMAERYLPDLGTRSLALLDKVALCEKYWVPVSECQADDDCGEASSCVSYTSETHGATVRLCAEPVGHEGDSCDGFDDGLICQDRCVFLLNDRSQGYCSVACMRDEECPDGGWRCEPQPGSTGPEFYCRDLHALPVLPAPPPREPDCQIVGFDRRRGGSGLTLLAIALAAMVWRRHRYDP
jgi:hypothetical protein